MMKLFEDKSDRRAEVLVICAEQVTEVYMDPEIEDSNIFIVTLRNEKPIGVDCQFWGTFARLQIDLLVDGILRNSESLVKRASKRDMRRYRFRTGFIKNLHGCFVEGTMWPNAFDYTPFTKSAGGNMGSLEIVISVARTEDEPTHASTDPNIFDRGIPAREYDGIIPRQNIIFARSGDQPNSYAITKLKQRSTQRRPGVEVWRRVKFLYRAEEDIKSAGLDPLSAVVRRFGLPPYVPPPKEAAPEASRQSTAESDIKEKPTDGFEARGKNNVDPRGVSAFLAASTIQQLQGRLISDINALATPTITQVRRVDVEQSGTSAPVTVTQNRGLGAGSGIVLTPTLTNSPQVVPPTQTIPNLGVNSSAVKTGQSDALIQGTATNSQGSTKNSCTSVLADLEHAAQVALPTNPMVLPSPTVRVGLIPEHTPTHFGESATPPLDSGRKRYASLSPELGVKKLKIEESDPSILSLARQLWDKRAARKEKERQLAEMKAKFAAMPKPELEACILREERLDSAVAAELEQFACFMDDLEGDRAAIGPTFSPSFHSASG